MGSFRKIDRLISIVIGTENFVDRPNSLLKSRAQIFDGPGSRFLITRRKNLRRKISKLLSLRTIEWE